MEIQPAPVLAKYQERVGQLTHEVVVLSAVNDELQQQLTVAHKAIAELEAELEKYEERESE